MFLNEVRCCDFGDMRLWKRFKTIGAGISRYTSCLITSCFSAKAEREAAYRFFDNEKVTTQKILEAHAPVVEERAQKAHDNDETVLSIQDTTTLSYSTHPCTKNLGRVGTNKTPGYGIMVHTSLLVHAEKNTALGIAHQSYFYHKEGEKNAQRHIQDKESYRWIEHLRHSHKLCPHAVHICDREGDIFEFLQEAQTLNAKFIVRQNQDRAIGETMFGKKEGHISDRLENGEIIGIYTVMIQNEPVELSIKFIHVQIAPPERTQEQKSQWSYHAIPITVVQVTGVKKNGENICWNLLTNLSVYDLESSRKIVKYYCQRWNIELFHKALKTGFSIEDARLEDGQNMQKLIAMISIEAARVYAMLYAARLEETSASADFFTQNELEAIMLLMKIKNPPNLLKIVEFIGANGGFVKTKQYPYPGVLTFFRGWNVIRHQIQGILLVWDR